MVDVRNFHIIGTIDGVFNIRVMGLVFWGGCKSQPSLTKPFGMGQEFRETTGSC
jgi:hypothetical protein